ncbi:hypothetical protein [Nitrospira moscoviensis]|uniref:Uncharacterized protein n=1 Tax=Nitrospira moscoviensis TaxID=42253 RepID=A0A0K2GE65_NITMO|nr:hypothetical protein [Nitrospira moscoviensis]ALA59154.1 conserved membrane protein of unknown function [Nitrospira moscoviensis]
MILLFKFAIAFAVASAVGAVMRWGMRPTGPWAKFWTVFLLLFLSAWAAGIWLTPLEPMDWGLSIPVFAALGFGVAAVLLLVGYPLHVPKRPDWQPPDAPAMDRVFQLPFWVLIAALVFTIALRYAA